MPVFFEFLKKNCRFADFDYSVILGGFYNNVDTRAKIEQVIAYSIRVM